MTGIAINRRELRPGRILAAMVLVTAGLLGGFGLAQLAAPADTATGIQISGASTEAYKAPGYHEYRAGERGVRAAVPVRHVGDAGP